MEIFACLYVLAGGVCVHSLFVLHFKQNPLNLGASQGRNFMFQALSSQLANWALNPIPSRRAVLVFGCCRHTMLCSCGSHWQSLEPDKEPC